MCGMFSTLFLEYIHIYIGNMRYCHSFEQSISHVHDVWLLVPCYRHEDIFCHSVTTDIIIIQS